MRKDKIIDAICVLNFVLLILLTLFLSSNSDILLFKTDIVNLVHFFSGFNLLLLSIALIPFIVIFNILSIEKKSRFIEFLSLFALANILFGFLYKAVVNNVIHFQNYALLFLIDATLYAVCLIIVLRITDKNTINTQVIKFSRILSVCMVIIFIVLTSYRHISKNVSHSDGPKKNLVLIVMDGLSTEALPVYNSAINIKEFDSILKDSRLYKNQYSNLVFTSGFFGVIYSGNKYVNLYSKKKPRSRDKHLLSILQKANINTRWSVYHQNAIPETNGISSYKGLRSIFLNDKLTWFPCLLGMDYNVNRFSGTSMHDSALRKLLQKIILKLLGRTENLFENYLVNEIKSLRKDKRPYFLIYHTTPSGRVHLKNKNYKKQYQLWEDASVVTEEDAILKKIMDDEYVYDNKHSRLVEKWHEEYKEEVRIGMEGLHAFFNAYKREGWDKDTILIVTADHGKIFAGGKIFYGYHHEEEVVKVPLIIFDNMNVGVDTRAGETTDLVQTIFDYFTIKDRLSPNAISLLDGKRTKPVTSLTAYSTVRKTQYVNVYKYMNADLHKYVFSLKMKHSLDPNKLEYMNAIQIAPRNSAGNNSTVNINDIISEYGLK